ncbi:MAG: hypothetical protein KGD60_14820, partial [Candidatus Thorarchaeota archaeon]|nr:hypothetical protein [Candidatus Thorarchaeota archaeon]
MDDYVVTVFELSSFQGRHGCRPLAYLSSYTLYLSGGRAEALAGENLRSMDTSPLTSSARVSRYTHLSSKDIESYFSRLFGV